MAKHYFTFVDRNLPLTFFEKEPVTVTLLIGDETDRKIDAAVEDLKKAPTVESRKKILAEILGEEALESILERAGEVDSYTLDQIFLYVQREYLQAKRKNLSTAGAGRGK